jgi:hypothetical protein
MRLKKRTFVLLGVMVVAIAAAIGAYAYWTTSGSGDGTAATGTSATVTVTQVGTVSALRPGGTAQAVDFKINNPQATKQYVGSVTVTIENADLSTWSDDADGVGGNPACTAADFTVVQPTAINSDLASGDTTFSPSGATIQLKDTALNQDNCKSVTVPLHFDANPS